MDSIVRGWIAVTDRAINDARDSLEPDDVARVRSALAQKLVDAFRDLSSFEAGGRRERKAAPRT